jgi:hypothetical protein
MIAYKLVRKLKSGKLTPLFINKRLGIDLDVWYESECHPTAGFKTRQGWHCTSTPVAPHLSKKNRVWIKVEIEGITEHQRPKNQGGLWYTADWIKFLEVLR